MNNIVKSYIVDEHGAIRDVIIDYKTSNMSKKFQYKEELTKDTDIEKIRKYIKSLQLYMYVYMYLQNNDDISIEQIDAQLLFLGDQNDLLLFKTKEDILKKDLYTYYNNILTSVFDNLFDETLPFIKYKDTDCSYCDFNNLCKFK